MWNGLFFSVSFLNCFEIFEVTDSQIKTYFWRNGTDLKLAANCFISYALFTQFSNGTPKVLLATGLSSEQKVI